MSKDDFDVEFLLAQQEFVGPSADLDGRIQMLARERSLTGRRTLTRVRRVNLLAVAAALAVGLCLGWSLKPQTKPDDLPAGTLLLSEFPQDTLQYLASVARPIEPEEPRRLDPRGFERLGDDESSASNSIGSEK